MIDIVDFESERNFIDKSNNDEVIGKVTSHVEGFYLTLYWKGHAFPEKIQVDTLDLSVEDFEFIYNMHV